MSEGLGKIPESLALRACLLCIESEMVRITEHAFKQQSGLIKFRGNRLAGPSQGFDEREGTHVESAFVAREAIDSRFGGVAVHKTIADETAVAWTLKNRIDRMQHPRIIGSHEKHKGHD